MVECTGMVTIETCLNCPFSDCVRYLEQDEKERKQEYYATHKDAIRERRKAYFRQRYQENKEKYKARQKEFCEKNPEKNKEYCKRYRERKEIEWQN